MGGIKGLRVRKNNTKYHRRRVDDEHWRVECSEVDVKALRKEINHDFVEELRARGLTSEERIIIKRLLSIVMKRIHYLDKCQKRNQ